MKFLDLFAGIGGFRFGMESAGHECIGFCEIDKFARASYKAIHNTKGEIELHDILKPALTNDVMAPILNYKNKIIDTEQQNIVNNFMGGAR
nr:MAG TPA: Cytosine specific methyltransferase [Caudoviricetes sp.]